MNADVGASGKEMPVEFRHLAHIDRLQVLSDRSSDVRSVPPVTVEIDPTNICNSNCWWVLDGQCSSEGPKRSDVRRGVAHRR